MNTKKYNIQSDVFDIAEDIKEIDDKYHIVYRPNKKMYEIHFGWGSRSHELSVPILNRSVIHKVLSTRTTPYQAKQLFKKIERENKVREERDMQNVKDRTEYQVQNMYQYLQLHQDLSRAYEDKWY